MAFIPLENPARLQDGYRRVFRVAGRHLLLLQHSGARHLIDNICPHAGYPMDQGLVIDGNLRCPMHGYLFSLHSGECVAAYEGPCNGVRVYAIEERDGMVGVDL